MMALVVLLNHFGLRYSKQCDSVKGFAKAAMGVEHMKNQPSAKQDLLGYGIRMRPGTERREVVESFVLS